MLKALLIGALAATGAGEAEIPKWDLGLDHTQAVLLYSHSLGYPARIKTCGKAVPAQKAELSQALKAWRSSNRDKLQEGRQALLDESPQSVHMVEANQKYLADQFAAKSVDELVDDCKSLLTELKPET